MLTSVKVTALPAALNVEVPVTVSAPVSVMAPPVVVAERLPPIVVPASWVATVFWTVASPAPPGVSVMTPVSALPALLSAMLPAVTRCRRPTRRRFR